MSIVLRKHLPIAIVTITGVIMLLERYIAPLKDSAAFANVTFIIQRFGMIIFAFTLGLGLATVLRLHLQNVRQKRGPWYISIWLIVLIVVFMGIGLPLGTNHEYYTVLFKWLYEPFSFTMMYGIFFLMYGIFWHILVRRAHDWEIMLFGIVFILTVLGQEPIGPAIWPGFATVMRWIEKVPNTGAIRAWMTLMAIGTVTTGVRVLLGKESRILGVE
jgi:uncharacterized membrane protein